MTAASSSFVAAMHVTALISVLIAAAGAVAVAIWMPGRVPVSPVAATPVPSAGAADVIAGAVDA